MIPIGKAVAVLIAELLEAVIAGEWEQAARKAEEAGRRRAVELAAKEAIKRKTKKT